MPFEDSAEYLYKNFVTDEINKALPILEDCVTNELKLYKDFFEAREHIKNFDVLDLLMVVYARAYLFGRQDEATILRLKGLNNE